MDKAVLIDGHSIINRAFYGIPDLTNDEGLHTNAVYGFLNIMLKVMDGEKPSYLAVAFDEHTPTFRHEKYAAYKGTRKPMPAELREQVPLLKEVLDAMGIRRISKERYEADDILGTCARLAEKEGLEVTIVSGDRDLLQLATDHTKIMIPKTKAGKTITEEYYAADVMETYQVTPLQFIDVKGLMGDSSDNIPGIPRVGEKTATKLIVAYGSIENAHQHLDEIKPKKAMESLRDHYDQALMSKDLATINTESPIDFAVEEAKLGEIFNKESYQMFARLGFKNLLARFFGEKMGKDWEEDFHFPQSKEEVEKLFAEFSQEKLLGVYLLTEKNQIYGLSLSRPGKDSLAFLFNEELPWEDIREHLRKLSLSSGVIALSDVKTFYRYVGTDLQGNFFDTTLGAYLLNPLKSKYEYEDIAREFAGENFPSRQEIIEKLSYEKALKKCPDQLLKLACYISKSSCDSVEEIKRNLDEKEMLRLFYELEMPLARVLASMEEEGITVKKEELIVYGERLTGRIQELETSIWQQAGEEFNINSPKQLGSILFEKMGLPGGKKTKTGYSTAADILEKMAAEHPIVSDVLEYRQLTKLKSTYADGLASCIQEDGKIHTNFNQTITATGRISSTDPNLQNIPIRMELGRLIRKVFVPGEDSVFLDADYSQIELRVLAHCSDDDNLIQAYHDARDIHRITASQVFHIPFDEVTDLQRRNAKAVNFGIVYGISSFGLSQDLSISRKEASEYIEGYFATYPGVKQFLDKLVKEAKEKGYAETLYGRRRPMPELSSSNFMQRSFGERVAMNAPIQGTAADIIKIAMIRVYDRLKKEGLRSRLILQVHDELLIETKKDEIPEVSRILKEEMMHAASLKVPLEVDMHQGDNWYEAK